MFVVSSLIPEENGKTDQPIEMTVALPNSQIRAKNRFVINGTANFGRNIPTEICGPPPEVIPNIPVRRNRNELRPKFPESLA